MQQPGIDDLARRLFETRDGVVASDLIRVLVSTAPQDPACSSVLTDYAFKGSIPHMRTHAMSSLVDSNALNAGHVEHFRKALEDANLRYWAIRGLVRSGGPSVYGEVVDFALDTKKPLEDRANAIKCLAQASGQLFDRELPRDPGHWTESQLRLHELIVWRDGGFPRGPGYQPPQRDAALDHPSTEFEKIVARLDEKLAPSRRKQDPADPWNCLIPASKEDLNMIRKRWRLPAVYLDFLTRFSPRKVSLYGPEYSRSLSIVGASGLIKAQLGFAIDHFTGRNFEIWRRDDLVIATDGNDPFVLRLGEGTTEDAPVYWAMAGSRRWDWEKRADSFQAFLKSVVDV